MTKLHSNQTVTCDKCDENRHDEYGEPCMECHTYVEKLHGLVVVEKLEEHRETCIEAFCFCQQLTERRKGNE